MKKDFFLPMFPYERIALHDPANMYITTLKQAGESERVSGQTTSVYIR